MFPQSLCFQRLGLQLGAIRKWWNLLDMGTNGGLLVIVGVALKGTGGPCPDYVSSVLLSGCKVSNPALPYIQGTVIQPPLEA